MAHKHSRLCVEGNPYTPLPHLSTRYTDVQRSRASMSNRLFGRTKWLQQAAGTAAEKSDCFDLCQSCSSDVLLMGKTRELKEQ
jgi:hypothetical protein